MCLGPVACVRWCSQVSSNQQRRFFGRDAVRVCDFERDRERDFAPFLERFRERERERDLERDFERDLDRERDFELDFVSVSRRKIN